MKKAAAFARLCILSSFVSLTAGADDRPFPGPPGSDPWVHRPNDPKYPDMWQLFSHLPKDHEGPISDWERQVGSGMHVDRAWQIHTGTPDTVIAVLDSGINWDDRDLIERHRLNVQELPLPEGSEQYDANGDGRVSVADYAADSRVHDANGNGVLDPGDLIKVFSDGVDGDQNGFVDDIAGWDFHEMDNDPADRTRFGHGTGEAKDSVAEINNGIGGAGICGDCSFVALRVDDSFVVNADSFSRAVIYAADNDIDLVQQALGSANWSPYTQEAVDYAYDRGMIIIGSAADENSYHHNFPSTLDPVVYTNSIRYDTREPEQASTFVNFNNCSNYGARVDVATSGRSCSSEATGNLSGITALAISYAKSLGRPLAVGELISLIKSTALDINLGSAPRDSFRHSSYAGWDTLTGYGRTDAYAILRAIKEDRIPPESRIVSPAWFEIYGAPSAEGIPVTIQARAPRTGSAKITLEIAGGVESSGADWVLVEEKEVQALGFAGEFARITPGILRSLPRLPLDDERNRRAVTLRLTVDDGRGGRGEARRTIFFNQDPDLLAGFPVALGASGESAGLFVDLDGEAGAEYVTADGGGRIHAFKADGREVAGFPAVTTRSRYDASEKPGVSPAYASVFAPIAAGDVTGDGAPEIVAATHEGTLAVVDRQGRAVPGFPVALPLPDWSRVSPDEITAWGVIAAPVLVDLDGDGTDDIVAASMDGHLHAYDGRGQALPGFPLAIEVDGVRAKITSSPAVYDLDDDGTPDLIFGTNHFGEDVGHLFAVSGHGMRVASPVFAGFPVRVPVIRDKILPTIGTGLPTAPVVGDVDGDGHVEIVVHAFIGKTYVFGTDGTLERSLSLTVAEGSDVADSHMLPAFGHPALADLDGDGDQEIMTVGAGKRMLVNLMLGGRRYDFDHVIGAWDGRTGEMLPGFPRKTNDMMLAASPVAADLDGDGVVDIAAGSSGYYVNAVNGQGPVAGWPKFTGGWMYGAPSLGDMDGDGYLELAGTTREGKLFVWRTKARDGRWTTFKGNSQRTGHRGETR